MSPSKPPTRARTGAAASPTVKDGGKTSRLIRYPTLQNAMRALLTDTGAERAEITLKPAAGHRLNMAARRSPSEHSKPSTNALLLLQEFTQGSYPAHSISHLTPSRTPPRMEAVTLRDVAGLGEMVRIRRHMLKLSQKELAERAGVGRRFVGELEAGKATVELGKVVAACRVLGLTLSLQIADGG